MFLIESIGKKFLALLLPVIFIFNWAACESFCAEITEHHNQTTVSKYHLEDETCNSVDNVSEGCKLTANAAVVETRQTVKLAALSVSSLPTLQYRVFSPAWSALLPEIKQNSPPKTSHKPLFVRLCTFRL